MNLKELKGKSREERSEYFKSHRSELLAAGLEKVNGGASTEVVNPDSEVPYAGKWYSSLGFVCGNSEMC